jgi:hypothetical protein
MKRKIGALLALAVLPALAIVAATSKYGVRPVYAQDGCSLATLNGRYGFSQQGFENRVGSDPAETKLPFADVGVFSFDGAGNFSVSYTDISPGPPAYVPVQATGSGAYTVNSACTGTLTCTTGDCAGVTLNTVTVGGGAEVFGILTTRNGLPESAVATSDFKKQ